MVQDIDGVENRKNTYEEMRGSTKSPGNSKGIGEGKHCELERRGIISVWRKP